MATVDTVLFLNDTVQPSAVGIDAVRFSFRAPPPAVMVAGANGSQPPAIGFFPAEQAIDAPKVLGLATTLLVPGTEATSVSP